MVPRHRVVDASLLMSAVSRKEPMDGRLTHGPGVRFMSTDTSVPQPRVAGLDVSDSALLATLLREAPIGFAFFGTDLRFRRINRSLARLHGRNGSDHLGLLPSQVWPEFLAARAEAAIHHVLADDQPLFEPDQRIGGPSAGQSREESLGSGWRDAVHPEDRERVERDWTDCVQAGKIFDNRYRVRTKTGSYRHYDVRAVPIERDGKIIEWVGASTDVTAQREAEEMRGRLTEQLSAAALRTARLQQATSMLAEALTVEQVVEVITEVGRSAIGADRSAVALLDPDRLRVRIINPTGLPEGPGAPAGDIPLDVPSVITMAINTRRPLLLENSDALRRVFDGLANVELFLTHTDERAWVGMPLLAAGAALGALRFSFTRPRKITDEDRVFREARAGQCALAVERASMFEREHTTAETLQRSLLPDQLPSVPGIILEARYLPVPRNREIGGDWSDAFRLPDGRLAVAAGDVMGKGRSAAAGMGRVRNALRALALTDPRPTAVLSGLDRLFAATEFDEQVTTVAYLVFDPVSGEGLAGNAGHPPPLLMSRDAPPRLDLGEAGTPLGWASPRQQYVFRLPPGNTAVLYTDGLVENRRRGLDAGLDELVAVAAQVSPGVSDDPARLLGFLVDRMLTGYEQDDDVTVLVLHVPRRDGGASAGEGGITKAAGRTGRA